MTLPVFEQNILLSMISMFFFAYVSICSTCGCTNPYSFPFPNNLGLGSLKNQGRFASIIGLSSMFWVGPKCSEDDTTTLS